MFSLKPKNKDNNQTPNRPLSNSNMKQPPKQSNTKQKLQSKKLTKTVFQDPFYYRIQLLPQEESCQVVEILIKYITKLRQSMPLKPACESLLKTIKFEADKNIKPKLSPLVCQQIVMGIKKTKSILYSHYKNNQSEKTKSIPYLTIIFYDDKKHQIMQQLLSLLKFLNSPYLLLKDNLEINRLLGVRTVGSLCLLNQNFANSLLKYIGKCLIDIPWLIQRDQVCKFQTE